MYIQVEFDDHNRPTNALTQVAVDECRKVGSSATTVQDILRGDGDHPVLTMIQDGINRVNKTVACRAHKVNIYNYSYCIFSNSGSFAGCQVEYIGERLFCRGRGIK